MKKLLLIYLLATSCLTYAFQATVTKVIDGDTFYADITDKYTDEKVNVCIRLWGIDCPEYSESNKYKIQDYGGSAKDFTSQLLKTGEKVNIEVKQPRCLYGRIVGIVTVGSKNLNEELLKKGLAWVFCHKCNNYCKEKQYKKRYSAFEEEAKNAKLNIWKNSNPTPPWEWRDKCKHLSKEEKKEWSSKQHIH